MSVKNSSPLGKGLKALLPVSFMENGFDLEGEHDTADRNSPYFQCPVDFIAANPYQPRKEVENAALEQLAASIREKGVLQPLLVRKVENNRYELIAGERRLRAAKLAGLEKVPVIEKDIALSDRLELALIENIQRENLNPLEEAEAYARLMSEFGMTQDSVSKRVGKDRSTIANSVRVLQLPDEVKEDLAAGRISSGHARVLVGLGDPELIKQIRDEIVTNKLSVRETEALVKQMKENKSGTAGNKKKAPPALPNSYCRSLSESMLNYLGSKARIVQNGDRGKIEIEYSSPIDLERLLALIVK
jgi:ParB family chromosome partitioning protein